MQWSYENRIAACSYWACKEIADFGEKQDYKMSDCLGKMDLLVDPFSAEVNNMVRLGMLLVINREVRNRKVAVLLIEVGGKNL